MSLALREFLLFLWPVSLAIFVGLNRTGHPRLARFSIVVVSLVFWNRIEPTLVPRFLLSVGVAYLMGQILVVGFGGRSHRGFFVLGVSAALVPLLWGWNPVHWHGGLACVLAFKLVEYLTDCFRGRLPVTTPLRFAASMLFFPQLLPGVHNSFRDLAPQFSGPEPRSEDFSHGLALFALGWLKWELAGAWFANGWVGLGLGAAGVLEMGIGVARTFGIRLPLRFAHRPLPDELPAGAIRVGLGAVSLAMVFVAGHLLGALPFLFWLTGRDHGGGLGQPGWGATVTAVLALVAVGLMGGPAQLPGGG